MNLQWSRRLDSMAQDGKEVAAGQWGWDIIGRRDFRDKFDHGYLRVS